MKPFAKFIPIAGLVLWLALPIAALSAPAATPAVSEEVDEYAAPPVSDPLERMNRAIFRFNDGFYTHALRPLARGYERVVPLPIRHGLTNFFDNLKFPVRFVSCALQAKPSRAARETGKFLLNSTVGLGGFVRASNSVPQLAAVAPEDIGQTFGFWGIGQGPFLVLPFLGPSSLRDAVGTVGDTMLNPVSWSGTSRTIRGYNSTWRYSLEAVDFINLSPDQIRTYDSFKHAAIDPYVSVRNGYLQYRAAAVKR